MDKKSYDLLFETHGLVKKIEGRINSLACKRNEDWINKVEKKVDKMPNRLWTLLLGMSMLFVGCLGVYQTYQVNALKAKVLYEQEKQIKISQKNN